MIETVDLEIRETAMVKYPTKQCPNCNSVDLNLEFSMDDMDRIVKNNEEAKYVSFVRCLNCNLSGPHHSTKEGGISVWNDLPRDGAIYREMKIENEKK